jgi:hypothetical protein
MMSSAAWARLVLSDLPRDKQSVTRRCTVARYCSVCPHGLQVMITSFARTSCKPLGNAGACLGNT